MFTTRVLILHTVHILIAAYFLASCKSYDTTNPSMPWHDMVCGRTEVGWGSSIQSFPSLDRFLHLDLGIFFILANVIPKYIKRDLAKRHQHNVVKRLRINPLLVHVIAGIATVIISGVVSWTEWYNRFTMTLVVVADLAHQFSIYRLLKNHDGIWQLRVGNMALGIAKWICVLRILVLGDWTGPTQVIFIHSMGFGLTRLFCFICNVVFTYVSEDLLRKEHWYSIGLSGAQFYCGYRNQSTYAPVFWISCVMCNIFYFGKKHDRKKQNESILSSIVMCLVCKFILADSLQIPAIVAYYMTGYWTPILHRTRNNQAPLTPRTPQINWKNGIRKSLAHVVRS